MHIPDAAISPATSLVAWAAMIPAWLAAGRRIRLRYSSRRIPLLAVGASFVFTIMMFNIPIPGGTTVHPTGGVLLAILLGPEAALIGMTVALAIQAFFFADGGVFALAANCLTMALAMPLLGYVVYRAVAAGSAVASRRRLIAAGIGAWAGLCFASLLVAIILGIQPALARRFGGIYFPYGLGVTIPAMLIPHLTIAGIAEGIVTAAAARAVVRAGIRLDDPPPSPAGRAAQGGILWACIFLLVALAPLGLLASGDAWGETERFSGGWGARLALMPDYLSSRGPFLYLVAALAGIALIAGSVLLVGRLLSRVGRRSEGRAPQTGTSEAAQGMPDARAIPGAIPEWLLHESGGEGALPVPRGRVLPRRGDFVERTIRGLVTGARDVLLAERWARSKGRLQRVRPEIKVSIALALIIGIAFLNHPAVLILVSLLSLAGACLSRIPPRTFLGRVWLTAPLMVGLIALPALIVDPKAGSRVALLLVLRAGAAVSCAVLLVLTTRFRDVVETFRQARVPRPFLSILAMAYRYASVLLRAAADVFTARKSRAGGGMTAADGRGFIASAMAGLFAKTIALAGEVHDAMLSRGWTGSAPPPMKDAR
jgi:cobalt/nickel transport system permease protein